MTFRLLRRTFNNARLDQSISSNELMTMTELAADITFKINSDDKITRREARNLAKIDRLLWMAERQYEAQLVKPDLITNHQTNHYTTHNNTTSTYTTHTDYSTTDNSVVNSTSTTTDDSKQIYTSGQVQVFEEISQTLGDVSQKFVIKGDGDINTDELIEFDPSNY